ncbi:hypothetical protein NN561_015362 [Cricetulus griseus]
MATPGNLGSSVLASKTKTKKKHFVAQKVKLFRASDPLLSVLMWGVNHSVSLLCSALLLLLGLSLLSSASPAAAVAGRGPLAGWLGGSQALPLLASPGAPSPTTCVRPLGSSGAACTPFLTEGGCGMRSVRCASEPPRLSPPAGRCPLPGKWKFVRGPTPPQLSAPAGDCLGPSSSDRPPSLEPIGPRVLCQWAGVPVPVRERPELPAGGLE